VVDGFCYGATDLPLAADPAPLAQQLRSQLPDLPVYSSPLRRCRQLADLLHPAPCFDARLREIDFGDWEMQAWDKLDRTLLDAWAADPLHFTPPGGESVAIMRTRVLDFLSTLETSAILVTHAGTIKLICAERQDLPPANWLALRFDYGSVTALLCDAPPSIPSTCAARNSAGHDRHRSR
jgi:alpha-ribazole phosphatase